MATLNFINPQTLILKVVNLFQKPAIAPPKKTSTFEEEAPLRISKPNSKLNVSLNDLKTISTALLHYRRSLARLGEEDRAQGVEEIDQKFYQIINFLETTPEEDSSFAA